MHYTTIIIIIIIVVVVVVVINTSDVLEHKWRASLKTIIFLYE